MSLVQTLAMTLAVVMKFVSGFPQSLQTGARTVPKIRLSLPYPFQFIINLSSDAILSELLTVSLNKPQVKK